MGRRPGLCGSAGAEVEDDFLGGLRIAGRCPAARGGWVFTPEVWPASIWVGGRFDSQFLHDGPTRFDLGPVGLLPLGDLMSLSFVDLLGTPTIVASASGNASGLANIDVQNPGGLYSDIEVLLLNGDDVVDFADLLIVLGNWS